MSRNTTTGKVLESMVLPSLQRVKYDFRPQAYIGKKPFNGKKWIADLVISTGGKKSIISLKWQEANGTAEEKVVYECGLLKYAVAELGYDGAYLVLGGTDYSKDDKQTGWTLRQSFMGGGIGKYFGWDIAPVKICSMEEMIKIINQRRI